MPTDTPRKSPRLQDMHLDISPGQRRAKGSTGSATSAGSDRYTQACARMSVSPEPAFLRLLQSPSLEGTSYSTAQAEGRLTADGVRAMVAALDTCRGLHTVRLVGLKRAGAPLLSTESLGALVRAVRANPSIVALDLSENALDDTHAAGHIGALITHNPSLVSLRLRGNLLKAEGGRAALDALASNRVLRDLDLGANPMVSWGAQATSLARMLQENTTLTALGVTLDDNQSSAFVHALARAPARLRTLRLVHNKITEKLCATGIAELLRSRAKVGLLELDLSHAYTQERGAIAVAEALRTNTTLTKLSLAHNGIAGAGAVALADVLTMNTTLTSASLASNLLTDSTAVALAAALAQNEVLTALELGRNGIATAGAQALRQALQANRTLVTLGDLATLPISVGLRASIDWYLKGNEELRDQAAVEQSGKQGHRDGLLKMLPEAEQHLRRQVYDLEDAYARANSERQQLGHENYQVNRLLDVTVTRNAELLESVATLQDRLEKLTALKRHGKKKATTAKKKGAKDLTGKQVRDVIKGEAREARLHQGGSFPHA